MFPSPLPCPLSFISRLLATCFPKCQWPGLFWGRVYCVSAPGDAVRLLAGGLVTETGHPALPSMCSLMYWGPPACLSCERSYVSFPLGRSVDWAEACHPPRKVSRLWLFCCMQTDPSCGNIHARWWQGPMCQQTGQTNWAIWRLSAQISELVVCIACWECKHVAMIPSSLSSYGMQYYISFALFSRVKVHAEAEKEAERNTPHPTSNCTILWVKPLPSHQN